MDGTLKKKKIKNTATLFDAFWQSSITLRKEHTSLNNQDQTKVGGRAQAAVYKTWDKNILRAVFILVFKIKVEVGLGASGAAAPTKKRLLC